MLPQEWVDLLIGILLKNKNYIKRGLYEIAENKPLFLPKGSLHLINEVLFASENKEKSEYMFEQLTAHTFKMISMNENVFLKRLKIKDL